MDAEAYVERSRRYLVASGDRRLEEAQRHLADDVTFELPSGTYRSLEAVVAGSRGRYRDIGKRFGSWDVAAKPDGTVVVVSVGTLHGVNVHGVAFAGVRYVDRIVYRGTSVVLHQVWNDLAESGVLERRVAD